MGRPVWAGDGEYLQIVVRQEVNCIYCLVCLYCLKPCRACLRNPPSSARPITSSESVLFFSCASRSYVLLHVEFGPLRGYRCSPAGQDLRHSSNVGSFGSRALSHTLVRLDAIKLTLSRLYEGHFRILDRYQDGKAFTLEKKGKP